MNTTKQLKAKTKIFLRPASSPNRSRLAIFLGISISVYLIIGIALVSIWYSKNINIAFHWFDDSHEWRLCDKLGHIYIAFTECRLAVNLFNWCGVNGRKKLIYSFMIAFCMQSTYEIFDGFAADYGASFYDIIANATGCLLVIAQFYIFGKIKLENQFNFSLTDYAALRPNMLGDHFWARYFKDYNGQTYWYTLKMSPKSILYKILPQWLTFSIGYGGDGLLGGHDNIWTDNVGITHNHSHIARASRFYLSVDLNFSNQKFGIKWLDNILYTTSYLKIPLPGIEYHTHKGFKWRWFCY